MSWLARIGALLAVVGIALAVVAAHLLNSYEEPAVDPAWAVRGNTVVPHGAVTVRWTGTATLVFSDGETTWLTDGWFTRPGPLQLLLGTIEPDLGAIEQGLARNGVEQAAAVFPVHSHYDHAMDAPEVCRRTGAVLLGSESTANIGRGWGLPEDRIRVVADREPIEIGRFTLTPIESRHFQFPDERMRERALADPEITEPLVPPVGAFEYKVGKAYVLHVSHPLGSFLVVGSAGFVEGDLEGFSADVVFLGTGGLGSQTEAYRETYWEETVGRTGPRRIIPIHWDSLTGPIEGPFTGPVRAAGFLSSGSENTLTFLKAKQAQSRGLEFWTLPRYDEVVLFSPLQPRARAPRAEPEGGGDRERGGAAPGATPSPVRPEADGGEGVAGRPLNRSPRTRTAYWTPRFPPDSRERELEQKAAELAFQQQLIAPGVLDARVDQAVETLDQLPPPELDKARNDAVREVAADAAIGEYLSKRRSGRTEQQNLDMWTTLSPTVDDDYRVRILEEMDREGALAPTEEDP